MGKEATQFKPGQSGNLSGRPKGAAHLAKLIRDATEQGAELVRRILAVARGEDEKLGDPQSVRWAHDWLADRAFGRPQQSIEVTTGDGPPVVDYSVLTTEEAEWYERITAKLMLACARPQDGDGGSDPVH
jgi:hypothetical protein